MTIRKFLDYSTAHLKPGTAQLLDDTPVEKWPIYGLRGVHGYFIWTQFEPDEHEDAPEDLLKVLEHAKANGAEYAMIDCDAPTVDGLATYEWEAV